MPKYFKIEKLLYICIPIIIGLNAGVVELVDTLDLGSSAVRCESSSLSACTTKKTSVIWRFFYARCPNFLGERRTGILFFYKKEENSRRLIT